MLQRLREVLLLVFCFASVPATAGYLSIGESGEVLPVGEYQFGVAPQLLLSEGSGANVDAFIDASVNEATSFRVQAGAGKIDFHVGGAVKWIPFPDVDEQPAMGGRAAAWYARTGGENVTTLQLAPLISRRLATEDRGTFFPYIAIPVNITSRKDKNVTGVQFTVGSEYRNPEMPNMLFASELAIDLKDSFSAINLSVAFPFDGERGFKR